MKGDPKIIPKLPDLQKKDLYERMCKNKEKYHSATHAKYVLGRIIEEGDLFGTETLKVYGCKFCKCFHIGNSKRIKSGFKGPKDIDQIVNGLIKLLDETLKANS